MHHEHLARAIEGAVGHAHELLPFLVGGSQLGLFLHLGVQGLELPVGVDEQGGRVAEIKQDIIEGGHLLFQPEQVPVDEAKQLAGGIGGEREGFGFLELYFLRGDAGFVEVAFGQGAVHLPAGAVGGQQAEVLGAVGVEVAGEILLQLVLGVAQLGGGLYIRFKLDDDLAVLRIGETRLVLTPPPPPISLYSALCVQRRPQIR